MSAEPEAAQLIGERIGNYQLERVLGSGGMGEVYLGRHTVLGRPAAVKILHHKFSRDEGIVKRFFNEARAAAAIDHEGIVDILDVGHTPDHRAYLIMEHLKGVNLADRLDEGPLSVKDAADIIRQCARALQAAHVAGIIHRDLKPENIFLVEDLSQTSGYRAKILDFGIAKLASTNPSAFRTSTGMIMGTPLYMSPEQCRGSGNVDLRTDIYSLACVLFHAVVGRPPFTDQAVGDLIASHLKDPAPRLDTIADGLPPELVRFTEQCLAKKAKDRPTTMDDVATFLSSPTLLGFAAAGVATPFRATTDENSPQRGLATAATQASSPLNQTGQDQLRSDIGRSLAHPAGHSEAFPTPRRGRTVAIIIGALAVLGGIIAIAVVSGDGDSAANAAAEQPIEQPPPVDPVPLIQAPTTGAAAPTTQPPAVSADPIPAPPVVRTVSVKLVAKPRADVRETADGPVLGKTPYEFKSPASDEPKTFYLSRRGYTPKQVSVAIDGNGRFSYRLDRIKKKRPPRKTPKSRIRSTIGSREPCAVRVLPTRSYVWSTLSA